MHDFGYHSCYVSIPYLIVRIYLCYYQGFIFLLLLILCIATEFATSLNVNFNQSTYSVNENDRILQPVLILSNPSSTDITVQVRSTDKTATGEYHDRGMYIIGSMQHRIVHCICLLIYKVAADMDCYNYTHIHK